MAVLLNVTLNCLDLIKSKAPGWYPYVTTFTRKRYKLRKRFNVPAYSDLHEMMLGEEIDVAVVLTPVVYMQSM